MATTFDGSGGEFIPATEAAKWTKNYRDASPADAIKAFYISRDIIEEIFAQTDCVGIRMYRAITDDSTPEEQVVIVGVTKDNVDITDGEKIADRCSPCPDCCDINSILFK